MSAPERPVRFESLSGILLEPVYRPDSLGDWAYADKLGDPTARMLGRVSLNPLVHIDWIGTVLLPIIAAISAVAFSAPMPGIYMPSRCSG